MADPVTLSLLLAGTTLAKTFVDVQAQNAQIDELTQQAGVRSEIANQQFVADTQAANRAAATRRARFAAMGLASSGSPLLVQEEQASASNFDARLRRFSPLNEGVGLMNDANQAPANRSVTLIGAGSSLLSQSSSFMPENAGGSGATKSGSKRVL